MDTHGKVKAASKIARGQEDRAGPQLAMPVPTDEEAELDAQDAVGAAEATSQALLGMAFLETPPGRRPRM